MSAPGAGRTFFGTDGVRGRANVHPMTADVALRMGQAVGTVFRRGGHRHRAVIGKDTRLSGYMIEGALMAGLTSAGWDVFLLGPMPTPATAMLTRSMRADLGMMISASHNPFEDNGVKLFGPDGYKPSDADQAALEAMLGTVPAVAAARDIGRAKRVEGAVGRYVEWTKTSIPRAVRLDGLRIVVDCAHGAAYRAAPDVLWELGAEVITIGAAPNGVNINADCGSTSPAACAQAVRDHGAHLGVALDGDADRVILLDETGAVIDGDQLMALIASRWAADGRLRGGALVATVMSNIGLERWLAGQGLRLTRTPVGDRHVVARMRADDCNVGGEQSGHIVLSDLSTTGDGLVAALQALAALVETGRPASETLHLFEPAPQRLRNVGYPPDSQPLETAAVREAMGAAERLLGAAGRLLIRPSGTETKIRVMAEGDDPAIVDQAVEMVCEAVRRVAV